MSISLTSPLVARESSHWKMYSNGGLKWFNPIQSELFPTYSARGPSKSPGVFLRKQNCRIKKSKKASYAQNTNCNKTHGVSELWDHHSENTTDFSSWGLPSPPPGLNRVKIISITFLVLTALNSPWQSKSLFL